MFFDDAATEKLLAREDNGFTSQQKQAAEELYNMMSRLSDETPSRIKPEELIDDPRWIEIRAAAAKLLALL
jgi:hypothetical protein